MNLYNVVLFVHVASDVALFIGIGAQVLALVLLRRTTSVEQVRALSGLIPLSNRVGVVGALLTIGSGLYLTLSVWGLRTGWIIVTLASISVLLPPLVAGVIEPRMHAILKMAQEVPDGSIPPSLDARLHDPLLVTALHTNLVVVLGIVFLMTTKPSVTGSVVAMAVAVALGLASALPRWFVNWSGRRSST